MTVHNLPEPGPAMLDAEQRTRAGRWKMLLILAICAAPVLASYLAYYVVRPEGGNSYGVLIDPQRPLPEVAARALDGGEMRLSQLKGQWLLLALGSGACDEACVQRLYWVRQLRESLGKDKDRVDRVWLVDDELPVADTLRPGLQDATVLRVPRETLTAWLAPANGQTLESHLYLIDPMGNWMMRFPANMDLAGAGKAKRDLLRLMRASSSWDREGR